MRIGPILGISAVVLILATPVLADVKPAMVFGSHMVLQRDLPVEIWGTAEGGEKVTVRFDDQTTSAVADAQGRWRVKLSPLKAEEKPRTLTISGKNTVTLEDVVVGEVWLGSGQSNMAAGTGKVGDLAHQSAIRLLGEDNGWVGCTPESAEKFSAVLFHFAVQIHKELKVPVGLINRSRGSKAIEVFMPPPQNGSLYKQLIEPLQPMTIRGVLWYQGEANRNDGLAYAAKQHALIEGWRKAWGRDFSFYAVQIAPFTGYGGQRLANWALAKDYGRTDIEYCSPLYKAMKIEGSKVRLFFSHAKGLKTSDGKSLTEFEIAGVDGKYVSGKATIDGDTVVVEADGVAKPVKVRYAWRNTPTVTLINGTGLPASAFHTDDWQGGTAE